MDTYRIAVMIGSLRQDSLNRKMALALAALAPQNFTFHHVRIDDLPPYNQDDDGRPGEAVKRLKTEIAGSQGVIFVTPEYNRSIPGVLKNAIDIASRPYAQSSFNGRPVGILSNSPGVLGGVSAAKHLQQILPGISGPILQQPETYLAAVGDGFNEAGELTKDSLREVLNAYVTAFAAFVAAHKK